GAAGAGVGASPPHPTGADHPGPPGPGGGGRDPYRRAALRDRAPRRAARGRRGPRRPGHRRARPARPAHQRLDAARDGRAGAAGLSGLVRRATEHATGELGAERVLPVLPELRELLPGGGLRRGSTVAVGARFDRAGRPVWSAGATSLLLALIAAASRAGSWCAVVGVPALGVAAADELGVALDR